MDDRYLLSYWARDSFKGRRADLPRHQGDDADDADVEDNEKEEVGPVFSLRGALGKVAAAVMVHGVTSSAMKILLASCDISLTTDRYFWL